MEPPPRTVENIALTKEQWPFLSALLAAAGEIPGKPCRFFTFSYSPDGLTVLNVKALDEADVHSVVSVTDKPVEDLWEFFNAACSKEWTLKDEIHIFTN